MERNHNRTHCREGHRLTPENTVTAGIGWRVCKACKKQKHAEAMARRRKQA
jgi:hypothetical protein